MRFRLRLWIFGICCIVVVGIMLFNASDPMAMAPVFQATATPYCSYHNATDQMAQITDVYGVRANIIYTDPYVPKYDFPDPRYTAAYVRVAAYSPGTGTPNYEAGWYKGYQFVAPAKKELWIGIMISWAPDLIGGNLAVNKFAPYPISGSHLYQIKYLPTKNKWRSFIDGIAVYGSGATSGVEVPLYVASYAVAGGEVNCGHEELKCSFIYNLQTRGFFGQATKTWQLWSSRFNYVDNPPYNNQEWIWPVPYHVYATHNSTSCTGLSTPVALSTATFQDYGED